MPWPECPRPRPEFPVRNRTRSRQLAAQSTTQEPREGGTPPRSVDEEDVEEDEPLTLEELGALVLTGPVSDAKAEGAKAIPENDVEEAAEPEAARQQSRHRAV